MKAIQAGTLACAGLASAIPNQGMAADDPSANLETVTVTGKRTTLDILTQKVLDTPQSIDVVPAAIITQQGLSSLQDALRNVPGITLNAGEGGSHGDQVNIRGFSANDDFFLDGLRDTGFYTRDSFNYDAVEVFKGPASTLFGRGSSGGVVNQVSKKPGLFPIEDAAITLGTNDEVRATADLNYVTGDTSALRVNMMGQRSDVEGRPFGRNQRWGIAPSFSYGIGQDTTYTLSYLHQQEDNLPDFGIPFLFGKPAPDYHENFYGLVKDDRQKSDVEVVTGRVDHSFSDTLSISDTARYGSYWFDTRQASPTYGDANCFDTTTPPYPGAALCANTTDPNPATLHNPLFPVLGTPLDQIFVRRDRPSLKGTISTLMNEVDVNAKFTTGPLSHVLVTGIEADQETGDLYRLENQDDDIVPSPLLNPDPYESFPGHQTALEGRPITKATTVGVFAIDTVQIDEHWNLVGAVRFDHFGVSFDDNVDVAHYSHDDNIVSPRAALVYKPDANSSLYFSYGTSFDPAAANLSLASSNNDLAPEKNRSFEIGGKVLLLNGLLAVTAAAFNSELTNARTADPEDPGQQTFSGKERVNGFEIGTTGHLTPQWEITAGYVYLDTRDLASQGPGLIGPIPNTAHNQAHLWTTYDFDSGINAGVGINYTGQRAAGFDTETVPGTTRIAKLPSYATVDGMIGYKLNDNVSLRLNAYNVANERYYASSYYISADENHAILGAGRTFLLTASLSR